MSSLFHILGRFTRRASRPGYLLALMSLSVGSAGLAGCGGDDDEPTIPGTYDLTQVNGDDLPEEAEGVNITDGTLTLTEDEEWTLTVDVDDFNDLEDGGTYTSDGNDIEFTSTQFPDDGDPTATLDGTTLEMDYDFDGDGTVETTFTFERQ